MTTRRDLRQTLARRLTGFHTSTATGGTTVTLVDIVGLQDTGASAARWEGAWLYVIEGANAGQIRRVTAYDPASGSLTVNRAFAVAIDSTSEYELHRLAAPEDLHYAINDALHRCWYRAMSVLTDVPDGDMESSGASQWTGVNASLSKVAAGSDVLSGVRALQVVTSAANGYARSARLAVTPGSRVIVEAATAPGGFTARLTVRNATNGVTLETLSAIGVAWQLVRAGVTVPESCFELELWLGALESGATVRWDNAVFMPAARRQFALPAWVDREQQVVEVWLRVRDTPGSPSFVASTWWRLNPAPPGSAATYGLEVHEPVGNGAVLVVEALQPYTALTLDGDGTPAPEEWIVAGAMVEVYRRLTRDAPAGDIERYRRLQDDAAREFQHISRLYRPRVARRVMPAGWS